MLSGHVCQHPQIELASFELLQLHVRDTFTWCLDNTPQVLSFHISTNLVSLSPFKNPTIQAQCTLQSCCPNQCASPAYLA